jgi:hypothetical protein
MDKLYSFMPEVIANQCLIKYIAEKKWKFFDDIIVNVQEIYDYVVYPMCEFRLITDIDLGDEKGKRNSNTQAKLLLLQLKAVYLD